LSFITPYKMRPDVLIRTRPTANRGFADGVLLRSGAA
jgi:hypothetical protein